MQNSVPFLLLSSPFVVCAPKARRSDLHAHAPARALGGARRRRLSRGIILLVVISVAVLGAPVPGFAQDTPVIWGGGNGNWFPGTGQTSNWFLSLGGTPTTPPNGPGFSADIGTASGLGPITGTVTVNGPVNLPDGVSLGNGAAGGLVVSSKANTLTAGTMDVGFSGPGTSTLTIRNGGVVTDSYVYVGAVAGSSGSVTVSGTGSQWNVSNQFLLGDNGNGTLSIQSGGLVSTSNAAVGAYSGSAGQVTVSGVGSQWNDSGTVTIGESGS